MRLEWPVKSIRGQFLAAFFICIAVPVTVIFYFYYTSSQKLLIEEVSRANLQLLHNEAGAMNETAERMLHAANLISNDPEVLQFLKTDSLWMTDYDALQKYKVVDSRLNYTATFMLDGRAVIYLIDTRGYLYTNWKVNDTAKTHAKITGFGWREDPLVREGYPMWLLARAGQLDLNGLDPDEEMLVLVKDSREQLARSYGTVIVAYPLDLQSGRMKGERSAGDGIERLLLQDGKLLSGNPQLYDKLYVQAEGTAAAGYLKNGSMLDSLGWDLIHVSSKGQFTGQLEQLRNRSMIWLFLTFILLILLFVFLVLRIIRPVKQLVRAMTKVGMGDFHTVKIEGAYEMKLLYAHFLKMVANLQQMILNLSEEQKRKEEARFQALQSQIKPHFLFNTLNSIKWSARLSGAEHVSRMINSLGKLLSASMRHDREIVSLREELEFVGYYVELQNIRFNHSIRLDIHVPEPLLAAGINKFTLQPLAENCIVHGGRFPEPLSIRIAAQAEGGLLLVTVEDDGKGVKEQLPLADSPGAGDGEEEGDGEEWNGKPGSGVGLRNLQERIHLYFGPQYGLTLEPGDGGGAAVRIRIPLREGENTHV
ncbi:MAG: hypothetical protein K0R57_2682 [Paenibacillaceae bacterium]|jgi:sensor histidine kinase YesM|nr:hypothetical protein [Paenibacillaceae bacterium]